MKMGNPKVEPEAPKPGGALKGGLRNEKDPPAPSPFVATERKCTDCHWTVLFCAWWVGMLVVAAIATEHGEPHRLFFGADFEGHTCGTAPDAGPVHRCTL